MRIPFQLKWPKSFSIWYDMGHIFLNAAQNIGGRRVEDEESRGGWLVGEFMKLFQSAFSGCNDTCYG